MWNQKAITVKTKGTLALRIAALAVMPLLAGCATVARENIISSINTGIGLSLTENPQTELYEVRAGYIRSQYYSVPSGKVVKRQKDGGASGSGYSNAAENTPEVVSGIRMKSDFRHLLVGASVSENFAVGKVAVMSPAAVAMYVAEAPDKERAQAAADAAGKTSALGKLKLESTYAPIERMEKQNPPGPSGWRAWHN